MPQFQLETSGKVDMHAIHNEPGKLNWIGVALSFGDLDEFTQGYIEALFFTWPEDEGDHVGGISSPAFDDLAPETLARTIADCSKFQEEAEKLLSDAFGHEFPARVIGDGTLPDSHRAAWNYDAAAAGRDFWFTRCGHGVGFWDRGLGDIGEKLSEVARQYGNRDQYLGDDGRVYLG